MNRFLNILVPVLILGLVGCGLWYKSPYGKPPLPIADLIPTPKQVELQLEVANTPETRAKGLQGRDSLAAGTGMLFAFDNADKRCMWNKGVKFPVAVAFFDEEGKLINDAVMPANSLEKVCSLAPAKFVVEANPV